MAGTAGANDVIEAREIYCRVGTKTILERVSLCVRSGEVLALVGPNGSGKSTLLRILSGELSPSQGEIWMNERRLDSWSASEQAQVRAVLPQTPHLYSAFTVEEVALMGRVPHIGKRSSEFDRRIAREALQRTNMLDCADRLYTTLSGGEKQRVQLARVFAQINAPEVSETRYLLLDEPTSSLDLKHQHALLQTAVQLSREGVAVLIVLHDLILAAQYADRVAVVQDGQIASCGLPMEVLTDELISKVFGIPASWLSWRNRESYASWSPFVDNMNAGVQTASTTS